VLAKLLAMARYLAAVVRQPIPEDAALSVARAAPVTRLAPALPERRRRCDQCGQRWITGLADDEYVCPRCNPSSSVRRSVAGNVEDVYATESRHE